MVILGVLLGFLIGVGVSVVIASLSTNETNKEHHFDERDSDDVMFTDDEDIEEGDEEDEDNCQGDDEDEDDYSGT